MLNINFIKQNADFVKERLLFKGFKDINLVDDLIDASKDKHALQQKSELIQYEINQVSTQIGVLFKNGEDVTKLKASISPLKQDLVVLVEDIRQLEDKIQNILYQLPNLPNEEVPYGESAEQNEVVYQEVVNTEKAPLAQYDLIEKYNLVNFELGSKITGRGFPVFIGDGAKLQRALTQYFLDFNTNAGYLEYIPPFMVNEDSALATGQLPDKDGQMYYMEKDELYLIPTAEVPVTNVYRDTIIKESDLPIKMTAHSPCFRREAGSFGKEVRGLNRVHQFEKVEIIQIAHPEKSETALNEMVEHVKNLLESLELPYRILKLCSHDMSFTSAITYDFEVWSPGQQMWLEVSSVSNFNTYQTHRMKCRFKDQNGKMQNPHSLNGSALALPRIYAALIETFQTERGIKIPEVLKPYFGKDYIE
jgi:seryl-tRNA synthetase